MQHKQKQKRTSKSTELAQTIQLKHLQIVSKHNISTLTLAIKQQQKKKKKQQNTQQISSAPDIIIT